MTDHTRGPFDEAEFAAHCGPGWRLMVVAETGSTNADLLAAAAAGGAEGAVLVAELQTGGRGRLQRRWLSPAGAGLTFSVLLRPRLPISGWGWLPLLTGLALSAVVGPQSRLKWPNDLLLGPEEAKVAGILVQAGSGAAVVGVGLNVSTTVAELAVPTATSLSLQGQHQLDRANLLARFLNAFDPLYRELQQHDGDAEASGLAGAYRARCSTLGRRVSVELPEQRLLGVASEVDATGRLLIEPDGGGQARAVAAGDVTHVRPISR